MTNSTTFSPGTAVASPWLNDVNGATYNGTGVYTPPGTGAVARTQGSKLQEFVSVLDFGADPTGVADSTSAFSAAIATGRKVYVPNTGGNAIYRVNNIPIVNNINIEGELVGITGPTLLITTNGAAAFIWTSTTTNASYPRIANFYVKANTGVTGALFYNQVNGGVYTAYGRFENINTDGSLLTSYNIFAIECQWISCHDGDPNFGTIGAQGHCAIINNPATYGQANTSNVNSLRNCRFFGAAPGTAAFAAAIDIGQGFDWYFDTCTFQQMTMQSIQTHGTQGVFFKNCWWEQINAAQMGTFAAAPITGQPSVPIVWEGGKQDCLQTTTQIWNLGNGCFVRFKDVTWTQTQSATTLVNNANYIVINENPYVGGSATNFGNGSNALIGGGGTSTTNSYTRSLGICAGVTTPAGGTAGVGLLIGSSGTLGLYFGSGVPTLSAAQGSLYMRTDGSSTSTRMYVNTNGGTTWTNVVTAA